jgi:hypothetical protein
LEKETTPYHGIDFRNSKVAILFIKSLDDFLGQHLGKGKSGSAVIRLYKNENALMDPQLVIESISLYGDPFARNMGPRKISSSWSCLKLVK